MNQEENRNIIWFYPEPVNKRAITISHADYLTLNQALMGEVANPVRVGVCPDDRTILLQKIETGGWNLPKNGVLRDQRIIKSLLEAGMTMPARFTVTETETGWVGTLDDNRPNHSSSKKKPQKPTKADLQSLRKEAKALCKNHSTNKMR